MLITDIEITQYTYCQSSARHSANVCMTLKNQVVTLFCQLRLSEQESSGEKARAFISDAMRQMRRMPEYRSGKATLSLADNLRLLGDPKPLHA